MNSDSAGYDASPEKAHGAVPKSGINQALSLAYLKKARLVTLRDGWMKLHHSKCNALCTPYAGRCRQGG